jgi:hypothetical protein
MSRVGGRAYWVWRRGEGWVFISQCDEVKDTLGGGEKN